MNRFEDFLFYLGVLKKDKNANAVYQKIRTNLWMIECVKSDLQVSCQWFFAK